MGSTNDDEAAVNAAAKPAEADVGADPVAGDIDDVNTELAADGGADKVPLDPGALGVE